MLLKIIWKCGLRSESVCMFYSLLIYPTTWLEHYDDLPGKKIITEKNIAAFNPQKQYTQGCVRFFVRGTQQRHHGPWWTVRARMYITTNARVRKIHSIPVSSVPKQHFMLRYKRHPKTSGKYIATWDGYLGPRLPLARWYGFLSDCCVWPGFVSLHFATIHLERGRKIQLVYFFKNHIFNFTRPYLSNAGKKLILYQWPNPIYI